MLEYIVSVDVETSGPRPGIHALLSIGAVAYNLEGKELAQFSTNISNGWDKGRSAPAPHPPTAKWWASQPHAQKALELNPEKLTGAMQRFATFLRSTYPGKPVMLAAPLIFDSSFINWAFMETNIESPFGFRGLDLKSFTMGALGVPYIGCIPSELEVDLPPHTHIAVDDALEQGELFWRVARKVGWPTYVSP